MLPRAQRLTTRQFDTIWKRGTSVCGALVCVRVLCGTSDMRIAAIAPRKIAQTAVARARIRRRIYGILTSVIADVSPGSWLIVQARRPLVGIPPTTLADDLVRTLTQARARCRPQEHPGV